MFAGKLYRLVECRGREMMADGGRSGFVPKQNMICFAVSEPYAYVSTFLSSSDQKYQNIKMLYKKKIINIWWDARINQKIIPCWEEIKCQSLENSTV